MLYTNEIQAFVDATNELHNHGSDRKCNSVAHELATHARIFHFSIVWFKDPLMGGLYSSLEFFKILLALLSLLFLFVVLKERSK